MTANTTAITLGKASQLTQTLWSGDLPELENPIMFRKLV